MQCFGAGHSDTQPVPQQSLDVQLYSLLTGGVFSDSLNLFITNDCEVYYFLLFLMCLFPKQHVLMPSLYLVQTVRVLFRTHPRQCARGGLPVDLGRESGLGTGPTDGPGGRLGAEARCPSSPKRFCAGVVEDVALVQLLHPLSTDSFTPHSMSCAHHATEVGFHAR